MSYAPQIAAIQAQIDALITTPASVASEGHQVTYRKLQELQELLKYYQNLESAESSAPEDRMSPFRQYRKR